MRYEAVARHSRKRREYPIDLVAATAYNVSISPKYDSRNARSGNNFMRQLLIAAFVCILSSPSLAQPAPDGGARFDGERLVTIACPSNTESTAARGYKLQFPARVSDGRLVGERGAENGPGWLRIEGQIGADGTAVLDGHGRTGDPEFAVKQPPPSSPYSYHIEARFEGSGGSGRRLEQRVCSFEFVRR